MGKQHSELPELASIRRKKNLSLHEIAELTKINVNYLHAIEEGCFEKLPGGIYSRAYIRQYAKLIDFDESELLESYNSRMGIEPEPPEDPSQATPARRAMAYLFRRTAPLRRVLLIS